MVQDQFGDDAQSARMRFAEEVLEITESTVGGMDVGIVGNVVAVIAPRGRAEGQDPDRRDSKVLEVIQFLGEAGEIAHTVTGTIEEGTYVDFVNNRVFVP